MFQILILRYYQTRYYQKKLTQCPKCNSTMVPKKQIHTLNLLIYFIIAIVIGIITKGIYGLIFLVLCSSINNIFGRKVCRQCGIVLDTYEQNKGSENEETNEIHDL